MLGVALWTPKQTGFITAIPADVHRCSGFVQICLLLSPGLRPHVSGLFIFSHFGCEQDKIEKFLVLVVRRPHRRSRPDLSLLSGVRCEWLSGLWTWIEVRVEMRFVRVPHCTWFTASLNRDSWAMLLTVVLYRLFRTRCSAKKKTQIKDSCSHLHSWLLTAAIWAKLPFREFI